MQEKTPFSDDDRAKALAIVNIFETSRAFGDPAAVAVLNDGAGVSYGINQFTHRSGALAAVVETYINSGGTVGRVVLSDRLPLLRMSNRSGISRIAADAELKAALGNTAIKVLDVKPGDAVRF